MTSCVSEESIPIITLRAFELGLPNFPAHSSAAFKTGTRGFVFNCSCSLPAIESLDDRHRTRRFQSSEQINTNPPTAPPFAAFACWRSDTKTEPLPCYRLLILKCFASIDPDASQLPSPLPSSFVMNFGLPVVEKYPGQSQRRS